jgi:hypothetical protein
MRKVTDQLWFFRWLQIILGVFSICGLASRVSGGLSLYYTNRVFDDLISGTTLCGGAADDSVVNSELGYFATNVSYITLCGNSSQAAVGGMNSYIGESPQSILMTADITEEITAIKGTTGGNIGFSQQFAISGTMRFSVDSPGSFTFRVNSFNLFSDALSTPAAVHCYLSDITGINPETVVNFEHLITTATNISSSAPFFFTGTLTNGHTYEAAFLLRCRILFNNSLPPHMDRASATLNDFEFLATTSSCSNAAPLLSYAVTAGSLTLSWPVCASEFSLQESESIGPIANWTSVAIPPILSGDELAVTVGMTSPTRFYRLKRN